MHCVLVETAKLSMNNNRWRRSFSTNNKMNWLDCKHELLKHYSEEDIEKDSQGYVVKNYYVVSPHMKWKVLGKSKWYFYKDIDDLVTRYFKRENNNENNQSI